MGCARAKKYSFSYDNDELNEITQQAYVKRKRA